MASRTEDWGLPDRGRDTGVCIFLRGESADSLRVGVRGLATPPLSQIEGGSRRLPWTHVDWLFPGPSIVETISCGLVCLDCL